MASSLCCNSVSFAQQHNANAARRQPPLASGVIAPLPPTASLCHDRGMKRALLLPLLLAPLLTATPAMARDSLGMFGNWGAFRDAAVPRCYAIAMAEPGRGPRGTIAYADVGTWPRRGLRGQVHFRLSRRIDAHRAVTLSIGGQRIKLSAGGGDAWAPSPREDAAITAAMRSAGTMTLYAHDTSGKGFSDSYVLTGAATAMDAAMLGCARDR